jgi:hypothetical protein
MLVPSPSGVLDGSPRADIFFAKEINHRFGSFSIIVSIKFHSYDFSPIPTFRSDRQVNPPRFDVGEYCDFNAVVKSVTQKLLVMSLQRFRTYYHFNEYLGCIVDQ